jgi:hypothetical protein
LKQVRDLLHGPPLPVLCDKWNQSLSVAACGSATAC